MTQSILPIEMPPEQPENKTLGRIGDLRVRKPVRNQAEMVVRDLDSLIAEDHAVRAIWDFLNKLDLAAFYISISVLYIYQSRP